MKRCTTFLLAAVLAVIAGSSAHAQVGKSITIVEANVATEAEIAALPHMNAARAKALVGKRPFANMLALDMFLTSLGLTRAELTDLYGRMFLPVNLNTTTREEILLIPGTGTRMVREFLEYRPYKALAQFHREIGKYVDDKELARLEQYVFVPMDLNTASDADILTIPGLGNRMLREFKEYRPYKAIEQFRREIGKYVSKEEVARLERYVAIN
jgi:DNA uptake protein ComE-like DNA-binding protein